MVDELLFIFYGVSFVILIPTNMYLAKAYWQALYLYLPNSSFAGEAHANTLDTNGFRQAEDQRTLEDGT